MCILRDRYQRIASHRCFVAPLVWLARKKTATPYIRRLVLSMHQQKSTHKIICTQIKYGELRLGGVVARGALLLHVSHRDSGFRTRRVAGTVVVVLCTIRASLHPSSALIKFGISSDL